MTSSEARLIIAAYNRHEAEAGGIAHADIKECVRLAAAECGVSYEVAREALTDAWAAPMRAG